MPKLSFLGVVYLVGALIGTTGCTKLSPEEEPLAPLVTSLGSRRPLESRLTGGFIYIPCRYPSTSGLECGRCADRMERISPRAVALAIAKIAKQARTPRIRLRAEAVAYLAEGTKQGVTRAIQKLEAGAREGSDARILSDLAAAYIERACRDHTPYDLMRALTAAERAIKADPVLIEALFNRALILERLYLKRQAIEAWARYRAADPDSDWSREAAHHIKNLSSPARASFDESKQAILTSAAARGDTEVVLRLVRAFPQSARELAMNEILARWGESRKTGKNLDAAGALNTAREIGEALRSIGGDRMVADAVSVIDRLSASSPSTVARLARAHVAYGAAIRLFRGLSVEEADSGFRLAREEFSFAGSPMELWAECGVAGVELSHHRYEPAFKTFAALAKRVDRQLYPALYGRISWGMGLVRGRQGLLTEALDHYRDAEAAFEGAHEAYNELTMQSMSAEGLKLLGQDESAWTYRYRALATLTELPSGRQLHNLLWEAADDLLRNGQAVAAEIFQMEDVQVARESRDPFMIAEALHRHGRVLAALGRREEALREIVGARAANTRGASEVTRATTAADIDYAEGETQLPGDPRGALSLLTRAVESFREAGRPAEEILCRLKRARAYLALGREADAESDLSGALALFEEEREAIGVPSFRQSFSEAAQSLFDEMILVQAERHRDPRRALIMAERARTVPGEYGDRWVNRADVLTEIDLSRIPTDVALVEYALSGNRLLVWTIRRGGIEFMDRRIDPKAFALQVSEFTAAVRGGSEQAIADTSAKLYDDLIPPWVEELPESVQLVFIPDRILNGVPFAALKNPQTGLYFVEEHVSSIEPSVALYLASSARGSARGHKRWSALLVSNPKFDRMLFPLVDLPGTVAEIAEVGSLYSDRLILSGHEATRSRLLAEIDRHEVFGFSGHTVYNAHSPDDSYLVAAPESANRGAILARDIATLRFHRLRLVVLSSCHTSAVTSRRIGGLSGLAKPFLEAGAAAVLGTLWDVDDTAAGRLSLEVHRQFRESGDAAMSLRVAQLSVFHDSRLSTRLPKHWAGFQVVGRLNDATQARR